MSRQQGFMLVELLIVIALITLLTVGSIHWFKQRAEQLKIEQLAVWMLEAQQGVQGFINSHTPALLQATDLDLALEGIAQLRAPSLHELQQLGFLAPSFPLSHAVQVQLYREGACPGETCHVHAVIYSEKPLLNAKQRVDLPALAQWRLQTGGKGLVVTPQNPDWLIGSQLHLSHQDLGLTPALAPGTIALVASTNNAWFAVTNTEPTPETPETGSIYSDEDVIARRDVLAGRDVKAGRDIQADRYFILPYTSRPNSVCLTEGAISRADDGMGLLLCERGRWQMASADQLNNDVINRSLNYVFSIKDSSKGFKGDWLNKGGYAQTYIRDMFNYEHWLCTMPNPVSADGCSCAVSTPQLAHEEQRESYSGTQTTLFFYICT